MGNKAGQCDSFADLIVCKPNILKLINGLKDITIDEGQSIELQCKIEGQPLTVKWYKNGKELEPNNRMQINENPENGEYSLVISQAILGDGAAYRVLFTNDRGEVYSGAVTHVKAKKSQPMTLSASFVSPLDDVTIPEGDTLTLKCQIGGEPKPVVKWYRNGQELKPDDDLRIVIRLALDGTATLRLRDARKSDAGEFHVEAINEAGNAKSLCKVRVLTDLELPAVPKFIIPLKQTNAIPGTSAEFNVKVCGVPPPQLTWYLNGKQLTLAKRFAEEDLGDGNYRFTIKKVLEEDFGIIRCLAKNENGQDECEAIFEPNSEWLKKKREQEGYPPRFNVPLWDRRVPKGHPMSIECFVDAKPTAEIQWFKDGELLESSDEIEVWNTPADGACRVKISRFEKKNCGSYKCMAKNEYGMADTRSNLNVEIIEEEVAEQPKEYAPKFNPLLEDDTLKLGDSLKLQCCVDANPPANVTWYKDGLLLKTNEKCKLSYNPKSGQCLLTVDSVDDSYAGAYRCVALNSLGSTNTACNVGVKTKKEEVKFLFYYICDIKFNFTFTSEL